MSQSTHSSPLQMVEPREAFHRFKPENVVFVIALKPDGKPTGMVAGWSMKCSWEPPLYAVALSKQGYTHKRIQADGEFVIAVPNKSLQDAVEFFGSTHGNEVDKFQETGIQTIPARFVSPPLLKDATLNFECKLEKQVEAGDHIIFIGKILAAYWHPGKKVLLNMRKVNGKRIFEEF